MQKTYNCAKHLDMIAFNASFELFQKLKSRVKVLKNQEAYMVEKRATNENRVKADQRKWTAKTLSVK